MQTFQKDHPLKDETITVMLKPQFRKKSYIVPAKYRSMIEENGNTKEVLVYCNGLGINTMDYSDYIDMCNDTKPNDRTDKLNAKKYEFSAEIIHTHENMHSEKDMTLSHHGLTFKGNDKATLPERLFWLNKPNAEVNGVANGNDPIFEITVLGDYKKKKMVDLKTELELSNFVNSIQDVQSMNDIFYYFGLNPDGKTIDEMKVALLRGDISVQADGNKTEIGAILFTQNNAADFRRTFMTEGNVNKNLTLTINKAKHYNIITLTTVQGNRGWYYNQSFLGTDDTELQSYFNSKPQVLEAVVAKVERSEKSKYPVTHKDIIPEAAKTDAITEKTKLIEELFDLVNKEKVKLPKNILVSKLSVEELKSYIRQSEESLDELADEAINDFKDNKTEPLEETTGALYFERQKEGENGRDYRFRILDMLKDLNEKGKIDLSGVNVKGLKVPEIENYLKSYEKTLNLPA